MGWIADDVADLIPEIVMTDAEGYRHVSYSRSVAILGEAIKELSNDWKKRQEEYEAKLQQQQKEIDELKELVMKLISNRSP
jgi:L-cystine uptake protein TcyP (sodium:dicarboxylate symporter family)